MLLKLLITDMLYKAVQKSGVYADYTLSRSVVRLPCGCPFRRAFRIELDKD